MNVFFGIGRLTADPIIGVTSGTGTSVARYTLAIPRCRAGEQQITDFIRCKAFGKSADFAAKYLRKGQRVAVRRFAGSEQVREGRCAADDGGGRRQPAGVLRRAPQEAGRTGRRPGLPGIAGGGDGR